MDRLSPASEQRKYSLSEKITAIAGGLALAAGLGACGSKTEVSAQGGGQTTAVATETPGNHLSGENPGIGEAPQDEAPAAENAPENIPPEGGLPEVTVPREDVESGQAAPVPENPNGVYEPGPAPRHPGSPDIKNMVGSADAEGVGICFANEEFQITWANASGENFMDTYAQSVGVGNCEGKGYPLHNHGWGKDDTSESYHVCLPVKDESGTINYYLATASGGTSKDNKKSVRVSSLGTLENTPDDLFNRCNKDPGPDDVVSW